MSVIVPTRNSERTIEACLESIKSQLYRQVELIVVDNSSTDQTLEIAQRHSDLVDTFGPERSAQRNRGAWLAHGEFFLFVDSDMTLAPGVVSDCLDALRLNGAPGVVIPETSVGEGFWARCRALERSCYVGDDSIEAARFFTRGAFEASGGFDERLNAYEDWDLSIRVAAGNILPRTSSFITHDEGRLRIRAVFAKKRYYAASSILFLRKHGTSTLSQANLIFRPAFFRNWRRLVAHPILTTGVLILKSVETVAAIWGVFETWPRRRGTQRSRANEG